MPKTIFLFLLVNFFFFTAFAAGRFTIVGTVPSHFNGYLVELKSNNPAFEAIKTMATGGAFVISGNLGQEFELVNLTIRNGNVLVGGLSFFIKCEKMTLRLENLTQNQKDNLVFYNNIPFSNEYNQYLNVLQSLNDTLIIASRVIRQIAGSSEFIDKGDSLRSIINSIKKRILNWKIQAVKENSHSFLGLHILSNDIVDQPLNNFLITYDSLMLVYNFMDNLLKQTELGLLTFQKISKSKVISLKSPVPEFAFINKDKKKYALSSFRDKKYVLLCFWSSGCSPCIKNFSYLKNLNNQYRDKGLQLISISLDNEYVWRKAIKRFSLPWLETCDNEKYIGNASVKELYDISFIPQYFLINKDGHLIYHNVASKDDDDYSLLYKIIKDHLD